MEKNKHRDTNIKRVDKSEFVLVTYNKYNADIKIGVTDDLARLTVTDITFFPLFSLLASIIFIIAHLEKLLKEPK